MSTIEGIAPGKATLRCILLCWTGDYPAQCEVGKFIKNGKHPCRRDKLEGIEKPSMLISCTVLSIVTQCHAYLPFLLGTLLDRSVSTSSHYYFGNCRYHAKYPPEKRSLSDSVRDMNDIEDEDRVSVRAKLAKEMGFTGLSPLHRLHKLYGFNVLEDMV